MKYQNEGGPDLVQCFDPGTIATRPVPRNCGLTDLHVIFNALIGNHDARTRKFLTAVLRARRQFWHRRYGHALDGSVSNNGAKDGDENRQQL